MKVKCIYIVLVSNASAIHVTSHVPGHRNCSFLYIATSTLGGAYSKAAILVHRNYSSAHAFPVLATRYPLNYFELGECTCG